MMAKEIEIFIGRKEYWFSYFFYILLTNESYSINYLIELFDRYKNKLFRKFEQMTKEYCGRVWNDRLNFLEEKRSETSSVEKCSFDDFNQAE